MTLVNTEGSVTLAEQTNEVLICCGDIINLWVAKGRMDKTTSCHKVGAFSQLSFAKQ